MHVGFLTSELDHRSGWGHYSLELMAALQRAGVELTAIIPHNQPRPAGFSGEALLPGVNPPESPFLLRLLLAYPHVRAALAQCDVLHATVEPYAPLLMALARGRPAFQTVHGTYAYLPKMRRWPVGELYRRSFQRSTMLCVSHYTAQVVQEVVPGADTVVINNAIDAQRFARLPASFLKTGPMLLTVGGIKPRKSTLALVQALAVVRRTLPDVQAVIVGSINHSADYVRQVRAEIERLGLSDAVTLAGFVSDEELLRWYATADIFVMPSINEGYSFEGFGLVHLEASAASLPVIGTRGCGVVDAIDDGVTGFLLSQDQLSNELPDAILRLLSDPALIARMGAAGQAKARQQTWDSVAGQVIQQYEDALRRTRR